MSESIETLAKKHIFPIRYAKGHYYKYTGEHPFTSLVYPISDEFTSGLHVGFDMSGQIRFGPSLSWVDNIDFTFESLIKSSSITNV